MTKVLLTGASGFIGSNVLKYFLKHTDWHFTLINSWRHNGSPLNIEPSKRVRVITHDLTGPIPNIGKFEYIFNLASESHVDRSLADPVNFIENNVSVGLQMLEYARKHPPKMFLQFSTDEVYGTGKHKEWDVLLPSSPYAASKACQEMIAIAYWRSFGVPLVITNSNNVVGPNQNPEKFVPKIIGLIKAGKTVQLHTQGGELTRRYFNPVENVADALLFIAKRVLPVAYPDGHERPMRFGLSGGTELTTLEMATLIAKRLGKRFTYDKVDGDAVRPGIDKTYPETKSGLIKLGWKPPLKLEESLSWVK